MFDPAIDQTTEQEAEKEQVREFLSRAEIRTMRKDLQKLREAVALHERERIIGLKPQAAQAPRPAGTPPAREAKTIQGTAKIFQQKQEEEKEAMVDLKNYAQEPEKQQMLYLEEQKMDLQKELEILEKQKEPPLLLEKNKAALKRDETQKRLKVFLEEEKKIENEEKLISETEKTANLAQDREKLEKKRWAIEEKRQTAEKKTWAIERDLQNAESELKISDSECQKVVQEINEIKNKIERIDGSLRSIYAGIMAREQARINKEKERKSEEMLKREGEARKLKETVMEEQWAGRKETSGLSFLNKLPEDEKKQRMKQTIERTEGEEQEQRRKFLENVEKWSEERDKNQTNLPGPSTPTTPQQ